MTILKQIDKRVNLFIKLFAEEFEKRVKQRTPVRTGKLRNGWEIEITKDKINIKNDVEYAQFVEDGTENMRGAHMLKTTFSERNAIAKQAAKRATARTKGTK